MFELSLIGVGAGDPEQLTLQAARALNAADLVLIPRKGAEKADLADLRRAICAAVLTNPATVLAEFDLPTRDETIADYAARVALWHDAIAEAWVATLRAHPGARRGALLVWGDPSLYDSTLRIAQRVGRLLPLRVSVIPGVTAIQALAAAHAIPLNEVGAPVLITTGRRLRRDGWPPCADTLVVMLDGDCAFRALDPGGVRIWWGAYLGMAHQILMAGALAEVGADILAARAAARARHGWIMDTYILRRAAPPPRTAAP